VVLSRAIPGCEWLEITGRGTARLSVRLAIAAVSGSYAGQLSVFREQHLEYIEFKASASGDQGTAAADITVRLAAVGDDATLVSYEASGLVSGPVAGVGSRLLASIAKRIADDFLAAVEEQLTERAAVTAGAPPAVSQGPPGVRPAPVPPSPVPAATSSADAGTADADPAGDLGLADDAGAGDQAGPAGDRLDQGDLPSSAVAATPRRPRLAVAFGVGIALGLGGVIAAAILGRKGRHRRVAPR